MSEETPGSSAALVQVIVLLVDRESPAPEPDGLAAVALASVMARARDPSNPAWERWLSGPVGKSVRRADAKNYAKTAAAHPEAVEATHGRGRAMALPPLPMDALPRTLARLQVSGTRLPAGPEDPVTGDRPRIVLNRDLGMSTGKAAAQAAHALFAWVMELGPEPSVEWFRAGPQVCVGWQGEVELLAGAAAVGAGPLIHDAGHTEIAPGSVTALVVAPVPAGTPRRRRWWQLTGRKR
ncbi:MAG: hypothetical protein L0H86_11020 [Micrococcaceae bacterium]|nr:hypothetical protein [Micrococcaceae bacterium]